MMEQETSQRKRKGEETRTEQILYVRKWKIKDLTHEFLSVLLQTQHFVPVVLFSGNL